MKERIQIANRANRVADNLSRNLLLELLPEEPFHISHLSRPSPDAKGNFIKMIESGMAYISDTFKLTNNWTEMVNERRQQEKTIQDIKKTRIQNANTMFHTLTYESIIPYYLDYKRKGPDYAFKKWVETLPKQRIQVTKAPQNKATNGYLPVKVVAEEDNHENA